MNHSPSGPQELAATVGYRKPTPQPHQARLASSPRASSPRLEQGGRSETLIQGICFQRSSPPAFTPQSGFACRRLAQDGAFANPTTPAPAGLRRYATCPVPSVATAPSADARGSHVPAAPSRRLAGRRWSAYADDSGRSAFPLEPPSFAPQGVAALRPAISRKDATVASRSIRFSQAVLRARRGP